MVNIDPDKLSGAVKKVAVVGSAYKAIKDIIGALVFTLIFILASLFGLPWVFTIIAIILIWISVITRLIRLKRISKV